MINYNQLYYFYIVARTGTVTEGAKELRIAQPSLSAQIKVLETNLNKKLFERAGRRLRLTVDGEIVFGHCRKIFEAAEALKKDLARERLMQSHLHIGVSNDVERPFLVEMVGRITRSKTKARSIRIKMSSGANDRIIAQLKNQALDVAITAEPVFDPELSMIASVRMPVVLAFNGHGRFKKLSGATHHGLRGLLREMQVPWALPQRSMRLRRETDLFLEKIRINPEVVFESDVLATVVRAVVDDVGISLLPQPYIRSYTRSETIRWTSPIDGFWAHGLWLVARSREKDSTDLKMLKALFKQTIGC